MTNEQGILKFLGNGNAFSNKRGNNSAYMEIGTELFLIDAGEDVFMKLREKKLLENKSKIHIFITHLHSDHVGSLGSLIAYLYYVTYKCSKDNINIYFPTQALPDLLKMQGIGTQMYNFYINLWDEIAVDSPEKRLEYIFEENEHSFELDYKGQRGTYSIEFSMKNKFNIYFSSDCAGVKERLTQAKIYDEIYHEAASFKTSAHTSYEEIKEAFLKFSPSEKSRIWLMHLDDEFDEEQAVKDGFRITKI